MKKTLSLHYSAMIATCALVSASSVWSQSHNTHAHNLDAHVHGVAELLIAVESQKIEMQFLSPAANILGFEHSPSTDKQWRKISSAEKLLGKPDTLFSFEGNACQTLSATVEMPFNYEQPAEDNHHAHDEHPKAHDHHKNHSHEKHSADDGHTEVSALYQFQCAGETPKEIQVKLLDQFPAIESLKVQWITENSQGSQTLNHDRLLIDLE